MTAHAWTPTDSASDTFRDQQVDLDDGWHAIVGPCGDGRWSWEVWDQWLHNDLTCMLASGIALSEWSAKAASIDAFRALR